MSNGKEGNKEEGGKETPELTIEDLLKDLPLKEEQKALLVRVIGGVAESLTQINTRLESLEKQPAAATDNPDIYAGLSPEQRYQVLMAKAAAPAAAAQQGLLQALLSRAGGGGGGGDLAALAKSAESIQSLRAILMPAASPLQIAMEKAQVSQILAQTRLMNKVSGKSTDAYLDKITSDLEAAGAEGAEVPEGAEP